MFEIELNYDKTVETKKLVFIGQIYQKLFSYSFTVFYVVSGGYLCYEIFTTQIQNNPTTMDYFVAVFFPLLISLSIIALCVNLLTKDKLKEIEINISKSNAKQKILEAGTNLGWITHEVTENNILFLTKLSLFNGDFDRYQQISIIFFPDNRVYFNSMGYPRKNRHPSKFNYNYQKLTDEYFKIEKEYK